MTIAPIGATTDQIRQASQLLGANQAVNGAGFFKGAQAVSIDRIIDQTIDTAVWVAKRLPQEFFSWIAEALAKFHQIFTDLTGDTSAIGDHVQELFAAAQAIGAQADSVSQCRTTASQGWEGRGADTFGSRADAVGLATQAVAGVLASCGERHLLLAGQLGDSKRAVVKLVGNLARRLADFAFQVLVDFGLTLVGAGWDVVSGGLAGAAAGGFSGAVDGFARGYRNAGLIGGIAGGIVSGIGGLFGGARDGVQQGIEEAKARIRAAFDRYVRWAIPVVGAVLQEVAAFVRAHLDTMTTTLGQIANTGMRSERAAALLRGHSDPGTSSDGPAPGSYGDTVAGADPQARDGDMIALNEAMGRPDVDLPDGYTRATDADLAALGLTREQLQSGNGFEAEVFRTPDGGYVVTFAGTGSGAATQDPEGLKKDVIEDVIGGGTVSPQTQQVLAISDAIENSGNGDNVVYSGHSLGGRQAAIAAMNSGQPAVTYDAAGVSQATINYIANRNGDDPAVITQQANDGGIRRYYTGTDPLTAAQERLPHGISDSLPDAVGKPYQLGETYSGLPTGASVPEPYDGGHDLTYLDKLWQDQYGPNGRTPAR